MEKHEHPLSWEALTRIVLMGIIVYLCWRVLGVFPIIILSFVLAAAFYPVVHTVVRKTRMPLVLAIFLVLVVPILALIGLAVLFTPRIAAEVPVLLTSLDAIVGHSSRIPAFLQNINLTAYIQSHLDYASATVNIALAVFGVISTVVLAFFLMYDYQRLFELFIHVVPAREREKVKDLLEEVAIVTGRYIRGNFIISGICAIVLYIGLTLLHVPFALPLAIFAAILDLLPLVGQTIGAIPAVIIGFGVSPLTGVLVIVLHLLYQQAENAIISPVIYNKALNLYPSVSFISVLVGGGLFGILGAFLSLPVAASIPAILHYHKNYKVRHGLA